MCGGLNRRAALVYETHCSTRLYLLKTKSCPLFVSAILRKRYWRVATFSLWVEEGQSNAGKKAGQIAVGDVHQDTSEDGRGGEPRPNAGT